MKKILIHIFKEQAVAARINGTYDLFTNSRLYKVASKLIDLKTIEE